MLPDSDDAHLFRNLPTKLAYFSQIQARNDVFFFIFQVKIAIKQRKSENLLILRYYLVSFLVAPLNKISPYLHKIPSEGTPRSQVGNNMFPNWELQVTSQLLC